jgi:hypothetical protein
MRSSLTEELSLTDGNGERTMEIPAILGGVPVREKKLYYAHQYIDQADIDAVVSVLKSDYLTCGPHIDAVEEKLCRVTGAKYAVVCANGTAALHIACLAAGVGPGDEVITTPITFAASANCAYTAVHGRFLRISMTGPTTWIRRKRKRRSRIKQKRSSPSILPGQSVEEDRFIDICRSIILSISKTAPM